MVPFFRWKLDRSILLGCDTMPSFSAYSLIKSSISFLLTIVFLKIGRKLAKYVFRMFRKFEVALNITKQPSTPNLLLEPFFAERSLIGEIIRYNSNQLHLHISIILYPFCWIYSLRNWSCSLFYPSHSFVVSQ